MTENNTTPMQGQNQERRIPPTLSTRALAMALGIHPSTLYKAKKLTLPDGTVRTPAARIRNKLLWSTQGLEDLLDLEVLKK